MIRGSLADFSKTLQTERGSTHTFKQKEAPQKQRRRMQESSRAYPLGAYPTRCGTFLSTIRVGGRTKYLGTFRTPEEANQAFLKARAQRDRQA